MTYWASFIKHLRQDISQSPTRSGKTSREFFGCSPIEIEVMRKAQHAEHLPDLYVEFMLAMGRGITDWIPFNIKWQYPEVLEFKNKMGTSRFTQQHGGNFFVFGEYYHGGGYTFFFPSEHVPNPYVYYWDIEEDITRKADELSGFLINEFVID